MSDNLDLFTLLEKPTEALPNGEWVCICNAYKGSKEWEWRGDTRGHYYRAYRLLHVTRAHEPASKWRASAYAHQGLSTHSDWQPTPREAMEKLRSMLADLFIGCPSPGMAEEVTR